MVAGDAALLEVLGGEPLQLGQRRLLGVEAHVGVEPLQERRQRGQQRRVGVAGREVARARGDVQQRPGPAQRRAPADVAAAALAADDQAARAQPGERGRDGRRADRELARELAHGRQRVPGAQVAAADRLLEAVGELVCAARAQLVLCQFRQCSVL